MYALTPIAHGLTNYRRTPTYLFYNQIFRLLQLQNALHWGAKHGDENIVKLIAGTYKDYIKGVNETTVSFD